MNDRTEYFKQYYQQHKEYMSKQQAAYRQLIKEIPNYEPKLDLYYTREELKEAEDRGEGQINWKTWDRLIEQGKQEIKEFELEQQERKLHTNNHKTIVRYVYNLQGQLIAQGDAKSLETLLKPYGIFTKDTITKYANNKWIKDGFFFTNTNYKYKTLEQVIMAINLAKKRKKKD